MMEFLDYISDSLIKCKIVLEKSGKTELEILMVNKQAESIIGASAKDIINKKMTVIFPKLNDSLFEWPKILSEAAMTNDHKVIEQYVVPLEKYLRISIFGYEEGCFYIAMQDITEKKAFKRNMLEKEREIKLLESELKSRANVDILTKLYNLQFITDSINNSISSYMEEGANFCLLLIDIDDFNKVNLKHGINAGDNLLKDVAKMLSSVARKIDVVGRYGNDKFILILNNVDLDIGKLLANRIKMEIEQYDSNLIRGISICGSLVEYNGESIEEFLCKSEKLIKKAQAMGKGTVLS